VMRVLEQYWLGFQSFPRLAERRTKGSRVSYMFRTPTRDLECGGKVDMRVLAASNVSL